MHSSGLIKNNEPIVYALIDPDQIEGGGIKDFKKERLKKSELSVCRAWDASAEEARAYIVAKQLEKIATRTDEGYAWTPAKDIRAIRLTGLDIGAFCVVDDGLEDFKAHAVLGYSKAPEGYDGNKLANQREAARGNLLLLFSKSRRGWEDWSFG
ncbi:hypothetical protein [Mesorhizobium sp. M1406]|uniref:hypothetical protein n=1 Tax=Mesorhizobium sp. M1406 TaxID=2957099 RepID=UPI0033361533